MPALQKLGATKWLQLGWAYGPGGTALAGRTCGLSPPPAARRGHGTGGHHGLPFEAFTLPYRQRRAPACAFCRASAAWRPPRQSGEIDVQALGAVAQLVYPDWCADVEACPDDRQRAVGLDDRPAAFSALHRGVA